MKKLKTNLRSTPPTKAAAKAVSINKNTIKGQIKKILITLPTKEDREMAKKLARSRFVGGITQHQLEYGDVLLDTRIDRRASSGIDPDYLKNRALSIYQILEEAHVSALQKTEGDKETDIPYFSRLVETNLLKLV
jgi:hypothetical protein